MRTFSALLVASILLLAPIDIHAATEQPIACGTIAAIRATTNTGECRNVQVDESTGGLIVVTSPDSPGTDAFGRARVSNPSTLFDSKQIHDNQALFWDEALESGGGIAATHSTDTASTVIASTLNTAGVFTRQTFMRFNYQPGKSQQIMMTGVLDLSGGGEGVERRLGIFDDDNGLFFEFDDGAAGVTKRSSTSGSPVDTTVVQSSWNLDVMDGTGLSGLTIDWTKVLIFQIDFEWLGTGRVRMGIVIGGHLHHVHQFVHSNIATVVYMSTPNLPLRYQMVTTGSSPASSMSATCTTVTSEGGREETGLRRMLSTAGTHVDAATENILYSVVAIRLKSTHLGTVIRLAETSLMETAGNKQVEWSLILNGTIAGSPSWLALANSGVEYFLGATANTVTGGTIIDGGFFTSTVKGGSGGRSLMSANWLGASIAGVSDTIVLAVRPIAGSSAIDVEGALTWRETP